MNTDGARRGVMGVLILGMAGCASAPVERAAQPLPGGRQAVTIGMVRFTFEPEVVTLRAGVPVTITATSSSRIPHNITVLSLDGRPLKSVDIPAEGTETFEVTLPTPGRYVFYCDKLLHRWPFRMEGVLVAQ